MSVYLDVPGSQQVELTFDIEPAANRRYGEGTVAVVSFDAALCVTSFAATAVT